MVIEHGLFGVSSSPETKQLVAALCLAQAQYKAIPKTGNNAFKGYRYSTYRDICETLLPALLKCGFPMPTFQVGMVASVGNCMLGTLRHSSGEWISSVMPLRDQIDKAGERVEDNQSLEAANTYAKKMLFLGLAGGWSMGDEPHEEGDKKEEKPPAIDAVAKRLMEVKARGGASLFERAKTKLEAVIKVDSEVLKVMAGAQSLKVSGEMTAAEFAALEAIAPDWKTRAKPREKEVVA
jgi:ERF superfamily